MRTIEEINQEVQELSKTVYAMMDRLKDPSTLSAEEFTHIAYTINHGIHRIKELKEEVKEAKIKCIKDVLIDQLQSDINAVYGVEP